MPPRRSVPQKIWDLPMTWTHEEQDNYLSMTESKQDTADVNKYLEIRGPVPSTMYNKLVQMQVQIDPKKDRFTLKQFKMIFQLMKTLFPDDNRFRIRTHLVQRNEKMMKIFLEDFQNEVSYTLDYFKVKFNGARWELSEGAEAGVIQLATMRLQRGIPDMQTPNIPQTPHTPSVGQFTPFIYPGTPQPTPVTPPQQPNQANDINSYFSQQTQQPNIQSNVKMNAPDYGPNMNSIVQPNIQSNISSTEFQMSDSQEESDGFLSLFPQSDDSFDMMTWPNDFDDQNQDDTYDSYFGY
ncbi:hypothetical protein TRFO_20128 [Tritrichomonas foetus]|uniref:Uncharacterized protein n=1 Tax=Tritrichomonas foetus TaxID=1144522 RepID=A0A1J4KH76_9EUKA|nr:hypothetical protein TRFO_20128 [Tritrichomonas foetus]|eukprot:OHT10539.1 hypothetical protein TRFO_20128 [Tritrichomonas foetus]